MKNSDLKRLYGKDNMPNEDGFARLNDKGLIDTPVDSSSIVPPEGTAAGKVMASDGSGKTTWVDNGTEVVANPTLTGTEGALIGLQVGDTKYAVPTPTEVVANPTMAGTEAALTGLQVGDTKYSVDGKKCYRHCIQLIKNATNYCATEVITSSGTPFTYQDFYSFLSTISTSARKYIASGMTSIGTGNYIISSIYADSDSIYAYLPQQDTAVAIQLTTSFGDIVSEI